MFHVQVLYQILRVHKETFDYFSAFLFISFKGKDLIGKYSFLVGKLKEEFLIELIPENDRRFTDFFTQILILKFENMPINVGRFRSNLC